MAVKPLMVVPLTPKIVTSSLASTMPIINNSILTPRALHSTTDNRAKIVDISHELEMDRGVKTSGERQDNEIEEKPFMTGVRRVEDKMSETAQEVREKVHEAKEEIGDRLDQAIYKMASPKDEEFRRPIEKAPKQNKEELLTPGTHTKIGTRDNFNDDPGISLDQMHDKLHDVKETITESVKGAARSASQSVKDAAQSTSQSVKNTAQSTPETIGQVGNSLKETAKDVKDAVKSSVHNAKVKVKETITGEREKEKPDETKSEVRTAERNRGTGS